MVVKKEEEKVPLESFPGTKKDQLQALYDQWYGCTKCDLGELRNCEGHQEIGAILRGCGRLWAGASMNVLSWWVIGVPLAYYLAIVEDHNMQGLWVGFATAGVVQSGLQVSAPSPHSHRVHTPSRDASHCHNHDPPHST